jgi:hypothetical protein
VGAIIQVKYVHIIRAVSRIPKKGQGMDLEGNLEERKVGIDVANKLVSHGAEKLDIIRICGGEKKRGGEKKKGKVRLKYKLAFYPENRRVKFVQMQIGVKE